MSVKRLDGTPEMNSARSKLDGVLQTLVEKRDESPEKESTDVPSSPDVHLPSFKIETPEVLSPSKRGSRSAKKRKRGKDEPLSEDFGHFHHTYVMKLFDRSVDLAQFNEDAPLYPVCRAWLRNEPHNRNLVPRARSLTPEPLPQDEQDENRSRDVYCLPRPVMIKHEGSGEPIDLRVPSPMPVPEGHTDITTELDTAANPTQLLLDHMDRWKVIREKWRKQAHLNESRYAESLGILKEMFESQLKE